MNYGAGSAKKIVLVSRVRAVDSFIKQAKSYGRWQGTDDRSTPLLFVSD